MYLNEASGFYFGPCCRICQEKFVRELISSYFFFLFVLIKMLVFGQNYSFLTICVFDKGGASVGDPEEPTGDELR